uniref:Anthocyanidin 3-O-glucoside 2''-O-glucosyltransferase n=1 Tax=Opuntia streptacantha TaxID=393608 RepID=A0A7C9DEI6_OPUST
MGVTGNGTGARKTKLHVVMFPWFAFGHINPFIQLSNKLTSYGIQISFFSIPGNIPRIKSSLNLSPPNQIIPLAVPPVEGLSPNVDSSSFLPPQIYGLLSQALDQMQPQVKTLLTQLQPDIVFFDFVQHWLPPLASELGIKSANFSVFSAVANSYLVVPSRMPDPNQPPTIEDLKKPPPGFPETSVTGVRTFQAQDFMFLFKGSNGGAHRLLKDPVGETSSFGWPCCSHAALRNLRWCPNRGAGSWVGADWLTLFPGSEFWDRW